MLTVMRRMTKNRKMVDYPAINKKKYQFKVANLTEHLRHTWDSPVCVDGIRLLL